MTNFELNPEVRDVTRLSEFSQSRELEDMRRKISRRYGLDRSLAEDVCQDTLIVLFQKVNSGEVIDNVIHLVASIVRKLSLAAHRKARNCSRPEKEDVPVVHSDEKPHFNQDVVMAFFLLPEYERLTIGAHLFNQSQREVAKQRGWSDSKMSKQKTLVCNKIAKMVRQSEFPKTCLTVLGVEAVKTFIAQNRYDNNKATENARSGRHFVLDIYNDYRVVVSERGDADSTIDCQLLVPHLQQSANHNPGIYFVIVQIGKAVELANFSLLEANRLTLFTVGIGAGTTERSASDILIPRRILSYLQSL